MYMEIMGAGGEGREGEGALNKGLISPYLGLPPSSPPSPPAPMMETAQTNEHPKEPRLYPGFFPLGAHYVDVRETLCGDRRGRGAKTHVFFAISKVPARPSAGNGGVLCALLLHLLDLLP